MKSFYRIVLAVHLITFHNSAFSQVLIVSTKETTDISQKVYKILTEVIQLPAEIIKQRNSDRCQANREDELSYDLIICAKKNGELTFPVYKKTILKNSYKSFFVNYFFSG